MRRRNPEASPTIAPHQIHPELIAEARSWVADCTWKEQETGSEPAEDYADHEIVRGVHRHFDGGWAGFVQASRGWSRDTGWGPLPGSAAWKRAQEQAGSAR